jgi:hypothetical protein
MWAKIKAAQKSSGDQEKFPLFPKNTRIFHVEFFMAQSVLFFRIHRNLFVFFPNFNLLKIDGKVEKIPEALIFDYFGLQEHILKMREFFRQRKKIFTVSINGKILFYFSVLNCLELADKNMGKNSR